MRILLVRHGESQANIDQTLHKTIPDHEIALSSRGQKQPCQAAKHLTKFFRDTWGDPDEFKNIRYGKTLQGREGYIRGFPALVWNSPYRRTRDTADILTNNLDSFHIYRRENILLCEQQFGLFDGLDDDEIEEQYPNEYNTWKLCKQYNGKFWARYPMGESPFDAAIRIRQSFDDLKRHGNNKNVDNHIIVCHGTVVKLFVMMWFNYSPEWFAEERTIGNCGIYHIEGDQDLGWLFGGYKKGKLARR